jgi:DNA-directed RNA polymerase beta subunit
MAVKLPVPARKPGKTIRARKSYARLPNILDVPNLIKVQLDSFQRFEEEG